jgi:hypothetical protein
MRSSHLEHPAASGFIDLAKCKGDLGPGLEFASFGPWPGGDDRLPPEEVKRHPAVALAVAHHSSLYSMHSNKNGTARAYMLFAQGG